MASDEDTLRSLIAAHDRVLDLLRRYDAYYEGEQPLSYMHPELILQLEGQVRQVVVNWPQLVVDAVEERLDLDGFRRPGQLSGDDDLWAMWQANDLDEASQRVHVDALALGRSYVAVGSADSPDDPPVITDESPLDLYAAVDPKTRQVTAAVRRWCSDPYAEQNAAADMATLYLPDRTVTFTKTQARPLGQAVSEWTQTGADMHDLGAVPVVPVVNRARRKRQYGVSELAAVLPLSDAACKIATDMMVGANYHALPRYYATGVSDSDFVDEQGNPVSVWKTVTGRIWATENDEAKLGQFDASDLSNYHNTLKALAQLVASQYGLPPHYLGFSTDNPASAEGIKSSEARLVKRAERKQRQFGGPWEQVMRLAVRFQSARWDPDLRRLETMWRDASTPTIAQRADAAVKLHAAGLLPREQAWEDMGYTPVQRDRLRQMADEDQQRELDQYKLATAAQQVTGQQPGGPGEPADAGTGAG